MTKPKILIVDDDEAVLDFLQAKIGARKLKAAVSEAQRRANVRVSSGSSAAGS